MTNAFADDESADHKREAEKHFRAGVSLQKAEDYQSAITAFESSLRLYPTKGALFNLANCLRATHRYPEALDRLQRLESEFVLEEPMLSTVNMQVAELENLTATLLVEVHQPGAEVFVNGRSLGHTPLAGPVRLGLGDHEVRVVLDGFQTETLTVNLSPAAAITRQVSLQPASVAPVVEPAPATPATETAPTPTEPTTSGPEERPANSRLFEVGVVTTAAGALLTAGGLATGAWALSVDSSLQDSCKDGHCPTSEQRRIDRLDTLTSTTNVLLALGALVTAGGVTMWLLGVPDAEPTSARTDVHLLVTHRFLGGAVVQRF